MFRINAVSGGLYLGSELRMFQMQWMTVALLVIGADAVKPLTSAFASRSGALNPSPVPPEVYYNTAQLVEKWGYPVERHTAVTEDGYKLGLFRIPGSPSSPPKQHKPVVFLQHGLIECSDQWVIRGPQEDLVFLLADRGYDVWMGNFRGSAYSLNHVKMTVDDLEFWKFSWHENGVYDLAASIRHALAVSRERSLVYIGHSMGTSADMVLLSVRPEFNKLVRASFLLAPIGNLRENRGFVTRYLFLVPLLEGYFQLNDSHSSVFPRSETRATSVYNWCKPTMNIDCLNFYYDLVGYSPLEINETILPLFMSHVPCGSSLGQFRHYFQSFLYGELRYFDHGITENQKLYGNIVPPPYRLDKITSPMHLFYSEGDYLANVEDAEYLTNVMPSAKAHMVPLDTFNHGDYLWGIDSYSLLYKELFNIMESYRE